MITIDISKQCNKETRLIRFSDSSGSIENAELLRRYIDVVGINSEYLEIFLTSKEDAENLIKALQKAIELGWWKA